MLEIEGITKIFNRHSFDEKVAIRYGNRLIMMHKGKIILDVSGEGRQGLTVTEVFSGR